MCAAAGVREEAYRDVLIDGFVPTFSVALMFPFYDNTFEQDDFGKVINPDDFVIKDEDMDMGSMHAEAELQRGQKKL